MRRDINVDAGTAEIEMSDGCMRHYTYSNATQKFTGSDFSGTCAIRMCMEAQAVLSAWLRDVSTIFELLTPLADEKITLDFDRPGANYRAKLKYGTLLKVDADIEKPSMTCTMQALQPMTAAQLARALKCTQMIVDFAFNVA